MTKPLRVLEMFCGIGGVAAALGDRAEVVAAVDIDQDALAVYRSFVRSGSYLREGWRLRRFSPNEILRLLCFSRDYKIPAEIPLSRAWQLVGNSLSLRPVGHVLSAIPSLLRDRVR